MISETMFDFKGFYDKIVNDMPNGARIAEVGVADGASALYLARKMKEAGKEFNLRMIDSLAYGGSEQLKEIIANVLESGYADSIEIIPIDSLNASCKYPDNYFHHVFIDASHKYEETKADIRLWYRKVMEGYTLAGHDYNQDEVRRAVNEVIVGPEIYPTEKDYGVWAIKKFHSKIIR